MQRRTARLALWLLTAAAMCAAPPPWGGQAADCLAKNCQYRSQKLAGRIRRENRDDLDHQAGLQLRGRALPRHRGQPRRI